MIDKVPLVYFYAVEPGRYVAAYPTFVVGDDPASLMFTMQVDDISAALASGGRTTTEWPTTTSSRVVPM